MKSTESASGAAKPKVELNDETMAYIEQHELIQLILWSHPFELIDSEYGTVDMLQYCQLEQKRIQKGGDREAHIIEQDGMVSLWVDSPYAALLKACAARTTDGSRKEVSK